MPQTLFEKIWDDHLVARRADGRELIYIDRHVLHELHAPHAFEELEKQHRPVRRPDLTFSAHGSHRRHQARPRRQHQSVGRGLHQGDARGQRQEQHQGFRSPRSGAGHLACGRAGARHGAAGRDACGAGQPRQHRRRRRSAGVRLRHDRARAYPRDASDGDEAAEADAGPARRQAVAACHRKGCGAADHRRDRRRRRARPCRRICRLGDRAPCRSSSA